jgi:hypothetical protein
VPNARLGVRLRKFLESIGIDRLYRPLPSALVAIISFFAVGALGLDLLIPDILPFIDEAFLTLLALGGLSEISERRRVASGSVRTGRVQGVRVAVPELKTLPNRVSALIAQARHLRAEGSTVDGLDGLASMQDVVADLLDEMRKADAFLSRAENDPWLLDERIKKLERKAAQGDRAVSADVEAVRGHRLRVDAVLREREDVLEQLGILSGQIDALIEDLQAFEADPDATDFAVANMPDLHPKVARVLQSVEEARQAEQELEEALEAGRDGRPRKVAPHLH